MNHGVTIWLPASAGGRSQDLAIHELVKRPDKGLAAFFFSNQHQMENQKLNFHDWSKLMYEAYGMPGAIAVAFTCSALFRDLIGDQRQCFPLLNLYGPPASGKSAMAQSILALFGPGEHQTPLNPHSSNLSFMKRMTRCTNYAMWVDEYSNSIDPHKIQTLKCAYETDIPFGDFRHFNSAVIITGQEPPTLDVALLTRCNSVELSGVDKEKTKALKACEESGQLSAVALELLSFRYKMQAWFFLEHQMVLKTTQTMIRIEKFDMMHRIIHNYVTVIATLQVLKQEVKFGFSINDFMVYCLECMNRQSQLAGLPAEV